MTLYRGVRADVIPLVREIAKDLRYVNGNVEAAEGASVPVRLCVEPEGHWTVRWHLDVPYRATFEAHGAVPGCTNRGVARAFDAEQIAHDLLCQIDDKVAEYQAEAMETVRAVVAYRTRHGREKIRA